MINATSTLALAAALLAPAGYSPLTVPTAVSIVQEGPAELARGNVTKIDSANKSFNIKSEAEGAKDITVTWNDATVFMLDGKVVKWDEVVKERANLTVTHKKGVAIKVEGITKG